MIVAQKEAERDVAADFSGEGQAATEGTVKCV
jgi:hypothetical protein